MQEKLKHTTNARQRSVCAIKYQNGLGERTETLCKQVCNHPTSERTNNIVVSPSVLCSFDLYCLRNSPLSVATHADCETAFH